METDEELRERRDRLRAKLEKATRTRDRMKPGGACDRQSRWCGSLRFTLLGVEEEIEEARPTQGASFDV